MSNKSCSGHEAQPKISSVSGSSYAVPSLNTTARRWMSGHACFVWTDQH